MSLNSSSDFQTSLNFFISSRESTCANSTLGRHVLTAFASAYTLLILPLSVFVLSLGVQRWRRGLAATHSDFFTYHLAAVELLGVWGYVFYYCSSYLDQDLLWLLGVTFMSFTWAGQALFPILTCVERYLAVVHPITYRALRRAGGVRVRNVGAGCVWLLGLVWVCFLILLFIHNCYNLVPSAVLLTLSLTVMLFCSLSVLRVLRRRRPGKAGRVRADRAKRRAVRTIVTIMAALWLKLGGSVASVMLRFSPLLSLKCTGEASLLVFSLAGSLVLPVLFLHRAGRLPRCGPRTGPRRGSSAV